MTRKTISMPEDMAGWIEGRIARGQYNNESEYFRDLVRQDQDEEAKLEALRGAIAESNRQIARGEFTDIGSRVELAQFFDGLRKPRKGAKRSKAAVKTKANTRR